MLGRNLHTTEFATWSIILSVTSIVAVLFTSHTSLALGGLPSVAARTLRLRSLDAAHGIRDARFRISHARAQSHADARTLGPDCPQAQGQAQTRKDRQTDTSRRPSRFQGNEKKVRRACAATRCVRAMRCDALCGADGPRASLGKGDDDAFAVRVRAELDESSILGLRSNGQTHGCRNSICKKGLDSPPFPIIHVHVRIHIHSFHGYIPFESHDAP